MVLVKKVLAWCFVGLIVLGVAVGLLSARRPLDDSTAEVASRFSALTPELVERYKAADNLARSVDKKTDRDDAPEQLQDDYILWSEAIKHRGNVGEKVKLANRIESDLLRVATAIQRSPTLSKDEALSEKLSAINENKVNPVLVGEFDQAARRYEEKRNSLMLRASASVFSYTSIPELVTP